MNNVEKFAPLAGRLLMSVSFLTAAISKIQAPEIMAGFMQSVGLPSFLLYPAAALEVVGSLALILGWQTRWAALALAGFTLVATLFFHSNLADPVTQQMAFKNLAMIGGLLFLYAFGPGAFALDNRAPARLQAA